MSKSARKPDKTKNDGVKGLKTHAIASHNQSPLDARIIALVKFLARRAAEEDYRAHNANHHPDNSGK